MLKFQGPFAPSSESMVHGTERLSMKRSLRTHAFVALLIPIFGVPWVPTDANSRLLDENWSVDETAVIADYPHNEEGASAHAVRPANYGGWTFALHASRDGGSSDGLSSEVTLGGNRAVLRPWTEGQSPAGTWSEERLTHPGAWPDTGEAVVIRTQLGALDAGLPSGYGGNWTSGVIVGNAYIGVRFGLSPGQFRVFDISGHDHDHHVIGFGSQAGPSQTLSPSPAQDGALYDLEVIVGADDSVGIVFAGTPVATRTIPGTYGGAVSFIRQGDGRGVGLYGPLSIRVAPRGLDAWIAERGIPVDYRSGLREAHARLAGDDFDGARQGYLRLAAAAGTPREVRGTALLAAAHTYFVKQDYPAASAAFTRVAGADGILPHHRREAGERSLEMERLAAGLPARDPVAARTEVRDFPAPGKVFHVAPDGDDAASGERDAPFATLTRARDAIRELRAEEGMPEGGVTVFVRGGVYRADRTFELEREDSGTKDTPVVYRAFPGETPRFHGGIELRGFRPVRDERVLARLPGAARGRVLELDLAELGIENFGSLGLRGGPGTDMANAHPWVELFVDGEPMEPARWPNEGFVNTGAVHRGAFRTEEAGQPGEFEFPGERLRRWTQADDPWMFGYWGHLWAGLTLAVGDVDAQRGRIVTRDGPGYGIRQGMPFYVFNLLEELERPGEWFLDRSTGVLYLYPPGDLAGATVELSLLSEPFVRMREVRHVKLRGLVFECGRANGIEIEGGGDVLLAGCTLRRLGTNAIVIEDGSRHGVLGCDLHTLGAGGVRIAGGDVPTLTPGEHFVANTHVRDFTRVDRAYAPAVHVDGVGNHVRHNLFHDSPHHGIRVHGFEHIVELNEVHSVVYESDDQSGLDMWSNHPYYRGNIIRYNFWHHIGSGRTHAGQAGIRLDDYISGTLMYGNVFYRASGPRFGAIQIHGGKDNIIDNNMFVDCRYAVSFSPWGPELWRQRVTRESVRRTAADLGIDVDRPPFSERYPDLERITEDADRNFVLRSVAVDCGRFTLREPGRNFLLDNHIFEDDPGFTDPEARDFSLPFDSPVYRRLGFRPIPFEEIGLYKDEYRASWPVAHEISPRYVPPR